MFFVSRVLRALSIASLRADFSERSLVVVVPFDSDLKRKRLKDLPMPPPSPLQLVLQKGNLPLESLNLTLGQGIGLQFLIQFGSCLGQFLQGDVQLIFNMLHLLLQVPHLHKEIQKVCLDHCASVLKDWLLFYFSVFRIFFRFGRSQLSKTKLSKIDTWRNYLIKSDLSWPAESCLLYVSSYSWE